MFLEQRILLLLLRQRLLAHRTSQSSGSRLRSGLLREVLRLRGDRQVSTLAGVLVVVELCPFADLMFSDTVRYIG